MGTFWPEISTANTQANIFREMTTLEVFPFDLDIGKREVNYLWKIPSNSSLQPSLVSRKRLMVGIIIFEQNKIESKNNTSEFQRSI